MLRTILIPWTLTVLAAWAAVGRAAAPDFLLPHNPVLPEGLGVNIHFTDPRPGELELLAAAGFRWVRMDFAWNATEREPGRYDFSAYDRLLAALQPHGIRALFILDYSNRHYDNDQSPASDAGRAAFARWAAAAVERFRGRGILWEMYNEPNIFFWRPKPEAEQYIKLALEVGKALRRVAPDEQYIGPATSTVDFSFLEKCFAGGLLEYWSAVSVHPYRQQPPETAADDYARLRQLIARYAPAGRRIPILSGEWGYSAAWRNLDAEKQGRMLPRQWLTNLAHDVPVSIWYDWHDDGPDPQEPEHHFGTVRHPYRGEQRPVYEPKPAYLAAQTLAATLAGCRFNKRLHVGGEEVFVLLFAKDDQVRLAAWTTAKEPRKVTIPASPGRFSATSHTGQSLPPVAADGRGLTVALSDAPQYLSPDQPNALLRVAAALQRAPLDALVAAPQPSVVVLTFRNPLAEPLRAGVARDQLAAVAPGQTVTLEYRHPMLRDAEARTVLLPCVIEGMGELTQTTRITVANPLSIEVLPATRDSLPLHIANPSGEAFCGVLRVTASAGLAPVRTALPLDWEAGRHAIDVALPLAAAPDESWRVGLRIEGPDGSLQLAPPPAAYRVVDDFARLTAESLPQAYHLVPDGDAQVASTQTMTLATPPAGPPQPGVAGLRITYRFEKGWKFVRLAPQEKDRLMIAGRPLACGLWVFGDDSGNHLRCRLVDASGQTFQPDAGRLDWRGWRFVRFPLDGSRSGHWGGANDGVLHYPLRWDTLLLIDSPHREPTSGEVHIASPTLMFASPEQ